MKKYKLIYLDSNMIRDSNVSNTFFNLIIRRSTYNILIMYKNNILTEKLNLMYFYEKL